MSVGYNEPGSLIAGRAPFLVPLEATINSKKISIPLLLFHGPYLSFLTNSMAVRVSAMTNLMNVSVPKDNTSQVSMGESNAGIICGDFNISYDPNDSKGDSAKSYGLIAGKPYNFIPSIVENNPGPPAAQKGVPSTEGGMAYDNIFYKLPVKPKFVSAEIFNPWTLWSKKNFNGITYADEDKARTAYFKWISDHSPAVLKVDF